MTCLSANLVFHAPGRPRAGEDGVRLVSTLRQPAPPAASPEALLPRVARGDERALREAIDRYSGLIWSLARRMCPTRADAEDAVQEIFIELWRCAERFDDRVAAEPTFVSMIARRRLVDRLRAASRRPVMTSDIEQAPAGTDGVGLGMEISEDARRARRAIAELRPEEQRVLDLSISRGYSHEQISVALDMPMGTVKSLCRRGLRKVREALAPSMSGEGGGA